MAYIKMIEESKAEGKLAKYYKQMGSKGDDTLDHILRIHSLSPESLKGHWELYRSVMFRDSSLTRVQREMIAVVVSKVNDCYY